MSSYLLMDGTETVKRVDVTHERNRPPKEAAQVWVEVPFPAKDYDADLQADGSYRYRPRTYPLDILRTGAKEKIAELARAETESTDIDRELADEAIRLAAEIDAGQSPAADDYPLIKAEAEERGLTRQEAINAVMAWVDQRKARLAEVHRLRTRAEMAIEAATTEQEIRDALNNVGIEL